MPDRPPDRHKPASEEERRAREAAALRANLIRRKQKVRPSATPDPKPEPRQA